MLHFQQLDLSNNLCVALSNKLPKSRMQRDLSDSSSQRNLGLCFGYSLQAISETTGGLAKCVVNKEKLAKDLNEKSYIETKKFIDSGRGALFGHDTLWYMPYFLRWCTRCL